MKGPFPLTPEEAERDEHGHGPWTRDLVRELAELAHAEGEPVPAPRSEVGVDVVGGEG